MSSLPRVFPPSAAVADPGAPDADGERLSGLTLVVEDEPPAGRTAAPRLSLGQPTTRRWSLDRDLEAVAEFGFDAVGLWKGKFEGKNRRRIARAVRASGVAVTSLSWVGGFTHGDSFERRQAWFEAVDAVKLAAGVGAKCLCVATGGSGGFTKRHATDALVPETLKRLAAVAAEFHVRLAVQPLTGRYGRNSVVRDVFSTLDLLDRVGQSNVGMVLPTALMAADPSLVNRVGEFATRVELVKLSDCRCDGGPADACRDGRMPGDGALPLATLVRRLEAAGYAGDYELDVWNEARWRNADHAADLRSARERFDALFVDDAGGR